MIQRHHARKNVIAEPFSDSSLPRSSSLDKLQWDIIGTLFDKKRGQWENQTSSDGGGLHHERRDISLSSTVTLLHHLLQPLSHQQLEAYRAA